MREIPFIKGYGFYELQAVGAKFYMDALNSIMKGVTTLTETAKLIPEDDNEYDPDAVAVEINDKKVGHLFADDVLQFRDWVEEKTGSVQPIYCEARITSSDKYGFCIHLDIDIYEF